MIVNQLTAFALLSSTHLLGQAEAPAAPAPTPDATPREEAQSEEVVEDEDATSTEDGEAAEAPIDAEEQQSDDADLSASETPNAKLRKYESDATVVEDSAAVAGSGPAPSAEEAEAEAEPVPINPRPVGDKERLGKHPFDAESSYYKPGTGLVLESKDGAFSMAPRLRIQFRDELEFSEDDAGDPVTTHAFGIRRARLQFKGHVFDKNFKYKAEFALSPNDLSMREGVPHRTPLLSWFTEFTHLRDLSLRIGQYKLLYSRQRVVSSGDQEFVDRTTAQNEFNLDRDIGFHFFSDDLLGLGIFKYYTGFTIAEGRDSFERELISGGQTQNSWQYLARVEVLPFGDFKDYSEVDFERENRVRLSVGAAYAHTENGTRDLGYQGDTFTDGGTVDYENVTVDALLKWAGLTVFAEYFYRNGQRGSAALDPQDAGPDDVFLSRDGLGGSLQAGYLLPRLPVGVGLRYSEVGRGPFDETESSITDEHEAGGTLGYYWAGHPLKLQADYFHLWSDEADEQADRIRVQLQVAY